MKPFPLSVCVSELTMSFPSARAASAPTHAFSDSRAWASAAPNYGIYTSGEKGWEVQMQSSMRCLEGAKSEYTYDLNLNNICKLGFMGDRWRKGKSGPLTNDLWRRYNDGHSPIMKLTTRIYAVLRPWSIQLGFKSNSSMKLNSIHLPLTELCGALTPKDYVEKENWFTRDPLTQCER